MATGTAGEETTELAQAFPLVTAAMVVGENPAKAAAAMLVVRVLTPVGRYIVKVVMVAEIMHHGGHAVSAIGRTDRRPAGPAPDRIEINVPRIGYYPRVPNPLGEGTYPGTLAVPTPAYRVRSVLRVI